MNKVRIYDTTLRDGAQAEGISFSVEDKLRIVEELDELGIHYIEGGWPGSNPKDLNFFRRVRSIPLKNSRIAAFTSTCRAHLKAEEDLNLKTLLRTGVSVATIFGKSWDLHVRYVLRVSPRENLRMISDSVRFLKSKGLEVIYDAEHFFDGYLDNPEFALQTILAAEEAGADYIVLCETNGGVMPGKVERIIKEIRTKVKAPLGMHAHNDSGMAVANSILAARLGVAQIQGTINGYGERSGNADLCQIIPNLKIKLGIDCITDEQMRKLTSVSRFVDEVANLIPNDKQPYVGRSVFAHKGGIHVDAMKKHPRTYEHIDPVLVGNQRRILLSELSGKSNILAKAEVLGISLGKDSLKAKRLLQLLKKMELDGYQFEAAEASFYLLMRKMVGEYKKFFDLEGFTVMVGKKGGSLSSEAVLKIKVGDKEEHTAAEGDGPVDALANALKKALLKFYPCLAEMRLTDFKVRIVDPQKGTAAKTRVIVEFMDHKDIWSTVGVSVNIIEASWRALVDSFEYKLLKDQERRENGVS